MNPYERLHIAPVINASGMMTALGGSTVTAEVGDAMSVAGQRQVEIAELQRAAGQAIAQSLGTEDAMVTAGAAAGIAIMVAALVAGTDPVRVEALPDPGDAPNEILIQAGHLVNFGAPVKQMIAMGGGKAVSVGSVNQVHPAHLGAVTAGRTAGALFVQSHHAVQKGMLPLVDFIDVCQDLGTPVLLDAAAEEDLCRFAQSGVDLVTFSGGKAIGGPSSGIIAGRADLIAACRAQLSGIGRPMKVGKESIVGLVTALDAYMHRDVAEARVREQEIVDYLRTELGKIPGVTTRELEDEAGRGIHRAAIQLDASRAAQLSLFLRHGNPAIYPRGHLINVGLVAFDPRPLTLHDASVIVERVRTFFENDPA